VLSGGTNFLKDLSQSTVIRFITILFETWGVV